MRNLDARTTLSIIGLTVILAYFAGLAWHGSYHFRPIQERVLLGYNRSGKCTAAIIDANWIGVRDCTDTELADAR